MALNSSFRLINRLISYKLGSKFSLGDTNDPHVIVEAAGDEGDSINAVGMWVNALPRLAVGLY